MGWMILKKGEDKVFWGDEPQDAVDNYLEKKGYIWHKPHSKEENDRILRNALNDKKLRKMLDRIFMRNLNRKPKTSEVDFHVCTALNTDVNLPRGCGVIKKYKPVKQKSGLYNILTGKRDMYG